MRGIFFQKPLEFGIKTDGESWRQGDTMSGILTLRNHGTEPVSIDPRVVLAAGELKKVRAKSEGAFRTLAEWGDFSRPIQLGPQQAHELSWSFTLDVNAPITDSSKSPFLLYGASSTPDQLDQLGQLQLNIVPSLVFEEFLNVFQARFRFVVKTRKFSKERVEVKLAPPDGQAFAALEHLMVGLEFSKSDRETLHIHYTFTTKRLEASAASIDVSKQKKALFQEISSGQYRLPSGRLDDERFEAAIREALDAGESKL